MNGCVMACVAMVTINYVIKEEGKEMFQNVNSEQLSDSFGVNQRFDKCSVSDDKSMFKSTVI